MEHIDELITVRFSVSLVNDVKIVLYRTGIPLEKITCIEDVWQK